MASAIDRKLDDALAQQAQGNFAAAEAAYRSVLAQQPSNADALHFLGLVLHQTGRSGEGIDLMRRSAALEPNVAIYHYNLGNALREQLRVDDAIAALRRATSLDPRLVDAWIQLGNCLRMQGKLDPALDAFKRVAGVPDSAGASSLLFTLWLHPKLDAQAIANEHRRWASAMADPLTAKAAPHTNDRNPHRRLRIGYVSQDFWGHVLGRFIQPILARHDRQNVEVFCYSDARREDQVTEKIRAAADHWRRITGIAHDRVAEQVRHDQIDILIDLSAHSGINRLPVFARKPAPLQVTYLGYPATTGMRAMDYRITDRYFDPPGATEAQHTEALVRLRDCYWCFPTPDIAVDVNELPASTRGHITFGCYNSIAKVNDEILAVWSKILQRIPGARLRVLVPGGIENNREMPNWFASNGVPLDRVDFAPSSRYTNYLQDYHLIDIGLDSFPFNGGATTLDAAYMGVAVITLTGDRTVSRGGSSILHNLNLPHLIAGTPDEYINIATTLAADLPALGELRKTLRSKLLTSALSDVPALTTSLESAYRSMWHRWCRNEPAVEINL
ncbi:MAG TPA: tetratricopeptide repeat protein [Tepidisphaeraceae bacterium]|jgi:predicted O-linked N-acetylglucosamine transferase (SPINDLY family)